MEICGGQTHAIMHFGIDQLLPRDDGQDGSTDTQYGNALGLRGWNRHDGHGPQRA